MDKEQMTEALTDLSRRRIEAFSAGTGKGLTTAEHLALVPESTTPADVDLLNEARHMLDDLSRGVLDLYVDVWREFGKGRCPVCGMTSKQARDANYNCAIEC
jgi:hypothetical protein